MNILDENVSGSQRELLRRWRIPIRQIGPDVGEKGLSDESIVVLLRELPRPTFFTRDIDFYRRSLCHPAYCLVYLAVTRYEVARFVRRFLRHPSFATYAQRRGTVVRVSHVEIQLWRLRDADEQHVAWLP